MPRVSRVGVSGNVHGDFLWQATDTETMARCTQRSRLPARCSESRPCSAGWFSQPSQPAQCFSLKQNQSSPATSQSAIQQYFSLTPNQPSYQPPASRTRRYRSLLFTPRPKKQFQEMRVYLIHFVFCIFEKEFSIFEVLNVD